MSVHKPSIDVVIPAYNALSYLRQAIDSVLGQSLLPDRIIIIDDGSKDSVGTAVDSYRREKIPVQCYRIPHQGLSAARNAGIALSRAEYIAFLDADDEWLPEKLEKQWYIFRTTRFPRLGVVYCDYGFITEWGHPDKMTAGRFRLDPSVRGEVFSRLLPANKIAGSASAVLVKRECFETVGGFDESLQSLEDIDMWLRIARRYQYDFSPEELVRIRRHTGNISDKLPQMLEAKVQLYRKWHNNAAVNTNVLRSWYAQVFYHTSLILRRLRAPFLSYQSGCRWVLLVAAHPVAAILGLWDVSRGSIQARSRKNNIRPL